MTDKKEPMQEQTKAPAEKQGKGLLTGLMDNIAPILCVLLILFAVYQQKQITGLHDAVSSLMTKEVDTTPKIAVISFDDTVESWAKIDPSGNLGRRAISKTVELYNGKGYLILDADAIIGDVGFAEFINVTPEAIKAKRGDNNE
ncbi:hypothetical protein F0267_01150 [Vibrio coralliilyticus]|uniref:Uncharacterized protein n=1 Tax=Vibrio coralliilyticus TaxID=190893 RepID=A0AAN0SHP4_9VIBR|nr:hypothetical protein [Vibrio coralliilyticus]AIW22722.1 hypothetical protein IX92_27115 [Vibrio coralliilyticus]NOH36829.1 hypothetical protein [Vibrio coralliilyticus]